MKGSVALTERCGGDEWSERRLQGIIYSVGRVVK
jgi:hypothetical protein